MRRLDLSVGGWLAVALGAAAALIAGVAAAALLGLSGIDAELARQQELVAPRADAAADLQLAVLRLGIAARAQALSPSPGRASAFSRTDRAVDDAFGELDRLPKDPDGAEAYARIPPLVASYRERARDLSRASGASLSDAEHRLAEVREVLLPALEAYVDLQEGKVRGSAATVVALRQRANRIMIAGLGAAGVLLLCVALLLRRGVRRPVLELVGLTRRVGAGDYAAASDVPAQGPGPAPRNELRELTVAFGAMARALHEREQRIAAQSEELQAQNEELQAQNEELQAQAQEIQSQQEELQAQNEELHVQADELRSSEEALRDADRRKDEFLAVLSHELRNPLAPIVNGLSILRHAGPGSPQAARAIEIVTRQVRQLVRLVDDLLDVTRISRGKVELRRVDADLAALVRHVAEDHRALLDGAGVHLEVSVSPGPILVHADAERLSQVVANLVQNAAKFTPRGGTVRLECSAAGSRATLRVKDDGEGIAPDLLGRLFVPFVQADASLARPRGGLGLGLALVKGLVELHGGSVSASSDGPGHGAEFTIVLPLDGASRRDGAAPRDGAASREPTRTPRPHKLPEETPPTS